MNWRTVTVVSTTLVFLSLSAYAFWLQDWQYSLPTPRPAGLLQPPLGTKLNLNLPVTPNQPVLLHFFNPSCPCSRFSIDHLRGLYNRHHKRVHFLAVLQGDSQDLQGDFNQLNLPMPSIVDTDGAIARATGVYSTPQAVLIDSSSSIYFRGNYNVSRYCTTPETAFASIALESMLRNQPPPNFPLTASIAFGCPLPRKSPRLVPGS